MLLVMHHLNMYTKAQHTFMEVDRTTCSHLLHYTVSSAESLDELLCAAIFSRIVYYDGPMMYVVWAYSLTFEMRPHESQELIQLIVSEHTVNETSKKAFLTLFLHLLNSENFKEKVLKSSPALAEVKYYSHILEFFKRNLGDQFFFVCLLAFLLNKISC